VRLAGVEARTFELEGTIDAQVAQEIAGPELEVEIANGGARLGLLLFRMRGLRPIGLPWPGLDYQEALWRIAVRKEGARGWFAPACDLDAALIRVSGALLVKYPVRKASIAIGEEEARVAVDDGALSFRARETGEAAAIEPPRRMFVRNAGRLYEIPWREDPPPEARRIDISMVSDSLSPTVIRGGVAWDAAGIAHRGRIHRCGIATRVPS
jgi:uncharacterized protein YqjF (DUF2071 family)